MDLGNRESDDWGSEKQGIEIIIPQLPGSDSVSVYLSIAATERFSLSMSLKYL